MSELSKKITVVIEYETLQEQPAFHANMTALGGKVVGVMFDDALEQLERAELIAESNNAIEDYEL